MDTVVEFVKHIFGFDTEEVEDFDKKHEEQDPFAWPYKDTIIKQYQSQNLEDHFSVSDAPKLLTQSTEDYISIKDSQRVLDDIFNSLLGEKDQTSTQNPLLKEIASILENGTTTTEKMFSTEKENSFETIAGEMPFDTSKHSYYSSITEDSLFNSETMSDLTGGISSEVRSETAFSSPMTSLTDILSGRSAASTTEHQFFETKMTPITDIDEAIGTEYLNSALKFDFMDVQTNIDSQTSEQPIKHLKDLKDMLISMETTKVDPAITEPIRNPGPISFAPETKEFFQSDVITESPFFKTVVTEVTTAATEQVQTASGEALNEIKLVLTDISTEKTELTTAANDTTFDMFTTATNEIVNVTNNVTFQPDEFKNTTGAITEEEGTNLWVFYVILATTVFILVMVISGVFLFYKKVRPGKGSGYQVSHMKEYRSSTSSENDTNIDGV